VRFDVLGFVYKASSEVLFERGKNVVTDGQLQNIPSSSYEAAMEKLSSLITRQRRGEKPPVANKLEKMSMYLKVISELFSHNFEVVVVTMMQCIYKLIIGCGIVFALISSKDVI
jgi:hypothetical protein